MPRVRMLTDVPSMILGLLRRRAGLSTAAVQKRGEQSVLRLRLHSIVPSVLLGQRRRRANLTTAAVQERGEQ